MIGDWVLTHETAELLEDENPVLIEFILLKGEEEWEEKMGRPRRYIMENYLRDNGLHKLIHKVKGDSFAYKEKGKLHWLNVKEISFIFRFDYEIGIWYSARKLGNKYRLSDNPYPQYPTSIAKKNAEFLYISTVKKEQHKIYRVKKSYDTIDELNTPTFGDMPHEENGYRYYALPVNENKVKSMKIFRTSNDYTAVPTVMAWGAYPSFISDLLDKVTTNVNLDLKTE